MQRVDFAAARRLAKRKSISQWTRAVSAICAAALSIGTLLVGSVPAQGAQIVPKYLPSASAGDLSMTCRDVLFVGARGSGEAFTFNDDLHGMGPKVSVIFNSYLAQLQQEGEMLGGWRSVAYNALEHYPAHPVYRTETTDPDESVLVDDKNHLVFGGTEAFFAGIDTGRDEAYQVLIKRHGQCPRERIVIAGYSQGAIALHRMLYQLDRDTSADAVRGGIDAIILVADGERQYNDKAFENKDPDFYDWMEGSADAGSKVLPHMGVLPANFLSQVKTLNQVRWQGRLLSICNKGDIVCDWADPLHLKVPSYHVEGNPWKAAEIHTSYDDDENRALLEAAGRWAAARTSEWPVPATGMMQLPQDRSIDVDLPDGYAGQLQSSGDGTGVRWALDTNERLPSGVHLTESGSITRTETAAPIPPTTKVVVRPKAKGGQGPFYSGVALTITWRFSTPAKAPAPPDKPTLTPGNGSLTATWAAPTSDGGSPITGYTATATPGGQSCPATATAPTCTIEGLTNGKTYTVQVRAINAVGPSTASPANSGMPVGAPDKPGKPTLKPSDRALTASWKAPASDGGSKITEYIATVSPASGAQPCKTRGTTSCMISGLTNGTTYNVSVTARNAIGTSEPSDVASGIPAKVPGPPSKPTVNPADRALVVSWTAGTNGGSAILGYIATATPGGRSCPLTKSLTCTITGLTNGKTYNVRVTAKNAIGTSPDSETTSGIPGPQPLKPGAPGKPTLVAGDGELIATWTAGTNGGSAITRYIATATSADTAGDHSCTTPGALTCTITGLVNGTTYNVRVTATNAVGTSPDSEATSGIPAGVPGAPTKPTLQPGDGALTATWKPTTNGGSPITSFTATASPGERSCTPKSELSASGTASCTITGLTNGTTYAVQVTASNALGRSGASAATTGTPVGAGSRPSEIALTTLSAGNVHSCGLDTAGRAWCWGDDEYGQLGDGDTTGVSKRTPVLVAGEHTFAEVEAGYGFTCGLDMGGKAWCWGYDKFGMLGDGDTNGVDKRTPVSAAGEHTFLMLSVGGSHSCAVDTAHQAWCWGNNFGSQLGDGDLGSLEKFTPVAVAGTHTFSTVTASRGDHSCGLDLDGRAWCWGYDGSGALGTGNQGSYGSVKPTPTAVAGEHVFKTIAGGGDFTCGIALDGQTWCWGKGSSGALGNQGTADNYTPTLVSGGHTFATLTTGEDHACAIDTTSQAWCWGSNAYPYGRLGDGDTTEIHSNPVAVAGSHSLTRVTAGLRHSCGLDIDGKAWCWGDDEYGQLGDEDRTGTNKLSPVAVAGNLAFKTP